MSDYPEHDKLLAVKEQTQAIGEFIDWMAERHRARFMRFWCGEWHQAPGHLEQWLAEWAGIDLKKIDEEKRAMLKALREMNEEGDDAGRNTADTGSDARGGDARGAEGGGGAEPSGAPRS